MGWHLFGSLCHLWKLASAELFYMQSGPGKSFSTAVAETCLSHIQWLSLLLTYCLGTDGIT